MTIEKFIKRIADHDFCKMLYKRLRKKLKLTTVTTKDFCNFFGITIDQFKLALNFTKFVNYTSETHIKFKCFKQIVKKIVLI